MSTIHKITPTTPPQFPCWLWKHTPPHWAPFSTNIFQHVQHTEYDRTWSEFTHWHPDQPTAPTATPDTSPERPIGSIGPDEAETLVDKLSSPENTKEVFAPPHFATAQELCKMLDAVNVELMNDLTTLRAKLEAAEANKSQLQQTIRCSDERDKKNHAFLLALMEAAGLKGEVGSVESLQKRVVAQLAAAKRDSERLTLSLVDHLYASENIVVIADGCRTEDRDRWVLTEVVRAAIDHARNHDTT